MNTQLQFGPWPPANVGAELDRRILAVLALNRAGSGLAEWQLELLRILAARKGREHAISIAQLRRLLPEDAVVCEPPTPREIKAAVKEMVERFGIPIGASRAKPHGYFLIVTPDDQADAIRPLVGELRSIARRIRALSGKTALAKLWGQLQLDLDKETENPSPQRSQSRTEAA